MAKFDLDEIVGAVFASNLAVLDALADQGAIDKAAIAKFLRATMDSPDAGDLRPSAHFVLSKIADHLEHGKSGQKVTLQ